MKQVRTFNAIAMVAALAFSAFSAPSMAQNASSSDTGEMHRHGGMKYYEADPNDPRPYMKPLDYHSWGSQPRTQFREETKTPPRGAQGPTRSEDAQGSRWSRMKSFWAEPVGNRGELGFLNWRENNTDTP